MIEGLNSRLCALNTLNDVFNNNKPLDIALDQQATNLNLSDKDKSFTHAICGFVLRFKQSLQVIINEAAERKKDITPQSLNTLLLIGVAQVHLMGVANHAAVDISVDLADRIDCRKQKGLINAILRRLTREKKLTLSPSVPSWLFKTWKEDYGLKTAININQASMKEAKRSITLKDSGKSQILTNTQAIPDIKGYDTGDWWVQDLSSHLPVSLLGDIKDKHVFDLCAAPGGKTMQLAALGAKVVAVDSSSKRLERLQENLERTKLTDNVNIVCEDLLKWNPTDKADIIILDAPCSATGTIRRHPDLPYIRAHKDFKSLQNLQHDLLNRAKKWIKPNGIIVYCVCSLQKNEGEKQIDKFLKSNPQFKRQKINQHKNWQTKDGDLRLLPTYGDMDGFFISYLINSI